MVTQSQPQDHADPDWSRSEAIAWLVRKIHNEAIGLYMGRRTEAQYDAIYEALHCALRELRNFTLDDGFNCAPGWCPDKADRCVPCDDEGIG